MSGCGPRTRLVLFCVGFDLFLAVSSSFSLLVRFWTRQCGILRYDGDSGRKINRNDTHILVCRIGLA
jgi:hypothetical protein